MKALFALTLALGSSATVSATALVVFLTPDYIILAGDNRLRVDGVPATHSHCKFARAGRWWLLTGGVNSVASLIADAVRPATTMADVQTALRREYPNIETILRQAERHYHNHAVNTPLLTTYVIGASPLEVGMFTVRVAQQRPFTLSGAVLACPGPLCDDDGRLLTGSSVTGPLVTLLATQPRPAWLDRADAAAARRLIELQIAATPEFVAPPIDVLEIRPTGVRWIDRAPTSPCPAI